MNMGSKSARGRPQTTAPSSKNQTLLFGSRLEVSWTLCHAKSGALLSVPPTPTPETTSWSARFWASAMALCLGMACSGSRLDEQVAPTPDSSWEWELPAGVPPPPVPQDNPMNAAKVELGRRLFYDTRLSQNQTISCASCHRQELAFTDGLARAVGSTGQVHPRGAMSLGNVAYAATLTWGNPLLTSLERHALAPLYGTTPPELGLVGGPVELVARLQADPVYPALFDQAFPEQRPPRITLWGLTRALAAFERTLLSFRSPYDHFLRGQTHAMTPQAKRGMALFFSERTECSHCHSGLNFTGSTRTTLSPSMEKPFHNTGLYMLDPQGAYPPGGQGIYEVTADPNDMGRFKAPSLRNIARTAPYMHDGSIATLEAVVDHYARGGRRIRQGPLAGDGSMNPLKSTFVPGFVLSDQEKQDLVAFLEALTDEEFLTNPAHSNPFAP